MVKGKKQEMKGKKRNDEKEVNAEAELLKAQLARTLADYDNLVKRVERERNDLAQMASVGILSRLLPILDNLESAQEHLQDQGLAISIVEFKKVLSEEGLTEIKPEVGTEFDENEMEVTETVPGGEPGTIAELVLSGWRFKDGQIVRVAKVKVFN